MNSTDETPAVDTVEDAVVDTTEAVVAEAAETTAPRRRSRRTPEVRIGFPGWAPFAFVGIFALGIVLGVVLMLIVDDDPEQVAATTTGGTTAVTSNNASPAGDGAATDDALAYGSVEIVGAALPRLGQSGADPAVGMPAPGLIGSDFEGNAVSIIPDDGQAKMIVFLAHWCPYCREEVPTLREWVTATPFPDNVDVYSVSTLTDPARANFPPATWFALEGWNIPLVVDDGSDTAANAFGLNAVPFWVLINSDNTIAGRGAGAVPTTVLDDVVTQLASGPAS